MSDLWIPGYERWELPGVPGTAFDQPDKPKALLHSTEGTSIDGAVSAYKAYPPHLCVDPARRRKVQHVSLTRAAYALWNADADDSRAYQVEIVGYAGKMHLLPDDQLRWLALEVFLPLHELVGVPLVVAPQGFRRDGEMPYALADARSPLRFTQAGYDAFSGFLGHQHVPGDSHWDPAGLDVPRGLRYVSEALALRGGSGGGGTTRPRKDDTMIHVPAAPGGGVQTIPIPLDRVCAVQIVPAGSTVWVEHIYNWGVDTGAEGDPNPRYGQPGVPALRVDEKRVRVFDIPAGTGKADLLYSSAAGFYVCVIDRPA